MSDRYSTVGKRYSTDGLIGCLQAYRGFQRDCFSKEEIDAIISRLRAADKLVAAWKAWKANPVKGTAGIVKAISDYEEAT